MITSLKGPGILKEEKDLIQKEGLAGVILFQKNILSLKQLFELCKELKALSLRRSSPPYFFIGMDLEGGRVNRLAHLKEMPWLPSASYMSRIGIKKLFQIANAKALLLKALGVDINFAPVVDVLAAKSAVLKTRTFGRQKKKVTACAIAYSKGLLKGGVAPCLKHFPGHGGVAGDSHKHLPKDKRNLKSLRGQLEVFQNVLTTGTPFVMTAHLEFPEVASGPATFSKVFLQQELRDRLGFQGAIVSDDIDMKALSGFSVEKRFFKALEAGCNLVLCCQDSSTTSRILKFFKDSKKRSSLEPFLKDSVHKLISLKRPQKAKLRWSEVLHALENLKHLSFKK